MELPECLTCPYWDITHGGTEKRPTDQEVEEGDWPAIECHRHAPVAGPMHKQGSEIFVQWDKHSLVWPKTHYYDWCGEHPDFPAYLEAIRRNREPSDM